MRLRAVRGAHWSAEGTVPPLCSGSTLFDGCSFTPKPKFTLVPTDRRSHLAPGLGLEIIKSFLAVTYPKCFRKKMEHQNKVKYLPSQELSNIMLLPERR